MICFLIQGDHVALLSSFAEMGLKLRLDLPEQAMDVTSIFFCASTPANEAAVSMHCLLLEFFLGISKSNL
jgi:aarF domain-containing kinase